METTQELLSRTIKSLFVQAARDGLITKYERDIIMQIEIDTNRYCLALEMAAEDGIINQHEKLALDQLVSEIRSNAEQVALSDNILSRNERDLLIKLDRILRLDFLL